MVVVLQSYISCFSSGHEILFGVVGVEVFKRINLAVVRAVIEFAVLEVQAQYRRVAVSIRYNALVAVFRNHVFLQKKNFPVAAHGVIVKRREFGHPLERVGIVLQSVRIVPVGKCNRRASEAQRANERAQ